MNAICPEVTLLESGRLAEPGQGPCRPVLAMGVFDGVHLGHLSLLRRAEETARSMGVPLWVLTFWPHPDTVVGRPERTEGYLLCGLEEKAALLSAAAVKRVLVLRFTWESAALSPEGFVDGLVAGITPSALVVGFNFTFGQGGRGGPDDLGRLAGERGVPVIVHPAVRAGGKVISSSSVRAALRSGEVHSAATLLGRPYSLPGTVVKGAGRGAGLGFPTANVAVDADRVMPATGVYVCSVAQEAVEGMTGCSGRESPAVANLGFCPTFHRDPNGERGPGPASLEAHIISGAIPGYGDAVRVFFHQYLRPETRFQGPESLAARIAADRDTARRFFERGGFCRTTGRA